MARGKSWQKNAMNVFVWNLCVCVCVCVLVRACVQSQLTLMPRIKRCHLLSSAFSLPRRHPLWGCQSQTPAVALHQNKRAACALVSLHMRVEQFVGYYVFSFCDGSSCSDSIISILKLVGAIASCIACFPLFAFMGAKVLLSFHILHGEYNHTWEPPTASKWTGRSLLYLCLLPCVCVCVSWLAGWTARGGGEGYGLEKQLRQDEPLSHLHLLSLSLSLSLTHTHTQTLWVNTPLADVQYFRQLSEDLAKQLSFFLIPLLLCPPFLFLLRSCLCASYSHCLSPSPSPAFPFSGFIPD